MRTLGPPFLSIFISKSGKLMNPVKQVIRSLLALLIVGLFLATQATAQTSSTDGTTPLAIAPGAPAGSYPLGDLDNINPYNGNLNFVLRLLGIGGRGSAGYTMLLPIEQHWRVLHRSNELQEREIPDYNGWRAITPRYVAGVLEGRVGKDSDLNCPPNPGHFVRLLARLTFTAPDGTEYELRDQLTGGQPQNYYCGSGQPFPSRGTVFVTADGTSATFVSDTIIRDDGSASNPSGYLSLRDGTRYRIDGGRVSWMRDRNGNKLSFGQYGSSITDSINRQITISYMDILQNRFYDEITFKGSGGASRTIRVNYTLLQNVLRTVRPGDLSTVQTLAALFPGLTGSSSSYFNPYVVSSVVLPDGVQQYQFLYNVYGELARVTLPTGGAVEYDFGSGISGSETGVFFPGIVPEIYRRVLRRRVYLDGGFTLEGMTTFSRPEYDGHSYVEIDHLRNDQTTLISRERHYFYGTASSSFVRGPVDYPGWQEGKEYQTEAIGADGTTVLRRIVKTWQQGCPVSSWSNSIPNNPRITQIDTTLVDTNQVARQTVGYDCYNNKTDMYEYDYGAGTAGPLVRRSHTDYVTATNYTAVTGAHLRSLPLQTSIYDVGGVERARTTLEYDNYATDTNHAALTNRPNISGLDSSFTTSYTTRGNVTATTRYLLTNGAVTGSVTSYGQYDIAGNPVKSIDARGCATTFDFSDRFGSPDAEARNNSGSAELAGQYSYAFPTLVTNCLGHTAYTQFDYYLARPVDAEDANGVVSSLYSENDLLDRPTRIIRAANQSSSVKSQSPLSYDDANHIITGTSDQTTFNDPNPLKSQTLYDGLGRTIESRTYEGGTNYIAAQTQYDALGRAFKVSNPFRPWKNETPVWTTSAFDALGRVVSVTAPDGAVVSTAYSGDRVLVTDQSGKQRISRTNGLGQLKDVWEVTAPESGVTESISFPGHPEVTAGYRTSYSYDTLGNLIRVTQGSQQRFFTYDSLSRLLRARNPEQAVNLNLPALTDPITGNSQWSMGYSYDNNGNLLTRIDARNVTSSYAYDALNRNTTVTYTNDPANTPAVTRTYDGATNGKGRLWKSQTNGDYGSLTTIDSYDPLGRPLIQRQQFYRAGTQDWSASFGVQHTYDLAGHVLTQTYPSGHSVSYNYDSAGRLADRNGQPAFGGNLGDGETRTYASSFQYDAASRLQQEQYGTLTPLYHKLHYNLRGQLYDMRLSTQSWQAAELDGDRGAIVNYYSNQNFTPGYTGTDNNGNVTRQEINIPGSTFYQQNFTYDSLNRLSSIGEKVNGTGNNTFKQSYLYDRWGNRRIDTANTFGAGINNKQFTVNAANNQLGVPSGQSGTMGYDAAGNLNNDTYTGGGLRTYDAENRMTQAWTGPNLNSYIYNADGQRVRRQVSGNETWQVFGMDGELLAEYAANDANVNSQKEYGYRGGQLLITARSGDDQRINRFLSNFYFAALGRAPSATELSQQHAAFIQAAQQGQSQLLAAAQTLGQQLFDLSNPNSEYNLRQRTDTQFVTDLYFSYLQRPPDDGGLGYFLWQLQNGVTRTQVRDGFGSGGDAEFVALVSTVYGITPSNMIDRVTHYLQGIYLGSAGGADNWTNDLNALQTAAADGQAPTIQAAQAIGIARFQPLLGSGTNQEFATKLFQAFLQREPSTTEVNTWVSTITKKGRASTLNAFATLAATVELAGTLYRELLWLTPDHLDTPRMISERSGSLAGIKRHDYLPFGEELFAGTGGRTTGQGYVGDTVRQQFTGYENDAETGLNFAQARYQSSTQGRFTSPDPLGGIKDNPQSFNRYSYVGNNPVNLVDPNGLKFDDRRLGLCGPACGGQEPQGDPQQGKPIDATLVTKDDPTYNPYAPLFKDPIIVRAGSPDLITTTVGEMATSVVMRATAEFPGVPRDPEGDDWVERYVSSPVRTAATVINWASQGARNVGYALLPDYVYVNGGVPLVASGSLSFSKDLHLYFSFVGPTAGAKNFKFGAQGGIAYFVTTEMSAQQRDKAIQGPGINASTPTPFGAYFPSSGGPPAVTIGGPFSLGVTASKTWQVF